MRLTEGADTATPRNLARRLDLIRQHVNGNDYVLDVGCGRAEYVRNLLAHAPNTFGIETSAQKVAECHRVRPHLRERVMKASAEAIPFPDRHFDLVILNEVLEHVLDQDAALREISRVMKPNGKLLLFCPNRLFLFETHGFLIHDVLRTWIPVVHYLPDWGLRWLQIEPVARNYWPKQAKRLLIQSGFAVLQRAFVQQTFENISGVQPPVVKALGPAFRKGVQLLGRIPLIRGFVSVSCFFVAASRPQALSAHVVGRSAVTSPVNTRLSAAERPQASDVA